MPFAAKPKTDNGLAKGTGVGGAIEFSPPQLPSYEVEGVKILLPHPVGEPSVT